MAGGGSPYRTGRASEPRGEAREDGIVDDLIRQFADPLAFYRELVQNSIDAGATRIVVSIGWDPDPRADGDDPGGVLTVSVRDDGCGMGRSVLENQLTVLFRSGKEGQEGKNGKFGVATAFRQWRTGGHSRERFETAMGSARETKAWLDTAVAMRLLTKQRVAKAWRLADGISAQLWRMTCGRR